jgi:hypothetical protein
MYVSPHEQSESTQDMPCRDIYETLNVINSGSFCNLHMLYSGSNARKWGPPFSMACDKDYQIEVQANLEDIRPCMPAWELISHKYCASWCLLTHLACTALTQFLMQGTLKLPARPQAITSSANDIMKSAAVGPSPRANHRLFCSFRYVSTWWC